MGSGASAQHAQLSLTDPKVCRSYMAGTCPHDLFTNTKQDLGPCPKIHSEPLKTEYEGKDASEKAKLGFEFDYSRDMQKYIDECNRRIDAAQRRLEKTPDEIRQTNELVRSPPPAADDTDEWASLQLKQISDLTQSINTGLLEVAILGESSNISLAVTEHHKIRVAKAAKEEKERELKSLSDTSGPSGHQKLQVCDVCGAYLSRLDNDRRLADHFYGKMHLGYAQMRKTYEALQKDLKGRAPPVREESADHRGPPRDDGWGERGGGGYGGNRGYRGGYGGRGGGGGFRGGRGRW